MWFAGGREGALLRVTGVSQVCRKTQARDSLTFGEWRAGCDLVFGG